MNKTDLIKYTGDLSQVFYARRFTFDEGRARGMRGIDVNNGAGLSFTVLPDRAMDIGLLSYKGVNFSYITKAGLSAPWHYDDRGAEWLKTFNGGFLTTCGLIQAGAPCVSEGVELGLHGDISATQAEELCVETVLGDEPEILIKGKMRSGRLFGDNLWMTREYRIKAGGNRISIKDTIENRGDKSVPYMILYHFNIGYPLLDENTRFVTDSEYIRPRDDEAAKGIAWRSEFKKPQKGFSEQVFYYKSKGEKCFAGVYNPSLETGIKLYVKAEQLPNIIQWKNAGWGDYVMGIEPANCYPEGREKQKEYGLVYLDSGKTAVQDIEIEVE